MVSEAWLHPSSLTPAHSCQLAGLGIVLCMPKPRHKLFPIRQLTFDLRPFLPLTIAFGSGILMALAIAP